VGDDTLAIDDMLEELRMLRHMVSEVINHCQCGGYVDRRGTLFKDLRRVHRATRDRQVELRPELERAPWYREADPRYWQNLACNLAWFAGDRASHLEGVWSVVLDSMLETGGVEVSSAARALAEQLGIELRQSSDGGKNWYPVAAMRARLEDATDLELELELQRRGKRKVPDPGPPVPDPGPPVPDPGPPVLEQLLRQVHDGVQALYVNRSTYEWLRREAEGAAANSTLDLPRGGPLRFMGVPVLVEGIGRLLPFQGMPIRPTDALLNTEAALDAGPYERHRPRCDVDECDARAVDGTDFCVEHQPSVVHDWMGQQGQRTTLCGQGNAEAAWSDTDQGAQVNCDTCISVRRSMEREQSAAGGEGFRQVPGGVFGYRGRGY